MQLMTDAIAKTIPNLYEQDGLGDNATIFAHWFSPYTGWDWYCMEYDPTNGVCFGLVKGMANELGYWTVHELEEVNESYGFPLIERDLYWTPCKLADVR